MELISLARYQAGARIGTGADYEVRTALDLETGATVVVKRPAPQMIKLKQHLSTEARTDRMIQAWRDVGRPLPGVSTILGYTEIGTHDEFFGDALGGEYRVIVEHRAKGIPLLGDHMARITGVPVGVGQNMFALHPLLHPKPSDGDQADGDQASGKPEYFPIQRQLLDVQQGFFEAGYLLLDLRPQNIFYQPAAQQITIIDCGALESMETQHQERQRPGSVPHDLHDLCLEILKFYATPEEPPAEAVGYKDPHGLRPVVRFDQELEELEQYFRTSADDRCQAAAMEVIGKVKNRAYSNLQGFRADLNAYLEAVAERNRAISNRDQTEQAWTEALDWLRADYWKRFLFDADIELAAFGQ
jgi:hypothetical protein